MRWDSQSYELKKLCSSQITQDVSGFNRDYFWISVEAATEWLASHEDDPDIDEPISSSEVDILGTSE